MQRENRQAQTPPAWSGKFYEFEDGIGVMSIHIADKARYLPPEGWVFENVYVDTEDSCQSFIYRKAAA